MSVHEVRKNKKKCKFFEKPWPCYYKWGDDERLYIPSIGARKLNFLEEAFTNFSFNYSTYDKESYGFNKNAFIIRFIKENSLKSYAILMRGYVDFCNFAVLVSGDKQKKFLTLPSFFEFIMSNDYVNLCGGFYSVTFNEFIRHYSLTNNLVLRLTRETMRKKILAYHKKYLT